MWSVRAYDRRIQVRNLRRLYIVQINECARDRRRHCHVADEQWWPATQVPQFQYCHC